MPNQKTAKQSTATLLRFNLFKSEELDFQFIRALAYASHDGASIGECLYAASQIDEHDPASWVTAWREVAASVKRTAEDALKQGHPVSARKLFLRAHNYYRSAEFFASVKTSEAGELYHRSLQCFDRAGPLFDPPFESIRIPYEGTFLPGHFFRVDRTATPRPTLILCGGGDGSGEELYFWAGREAIERGYNLLVFHGPGQRGALHQDARLVFRYDYEVPLKAVTDYALSRSEVAAQRLALMGVSLGGYFTPRAAASDHRIRALIANSPITDFHRWLLQAVEDSVGRLPSFVESVVMSFAERLLPRPLLDYVCWTYGVTKLTDYLEANRAFRLDDLPKQITCPTLCLGSAGEGREGQRQLHEFYEMLQCPKAEHLFTVAEGADSHCQLDNLSLSYQVAFDWLDEVLN